MNRYKTDSNGALLATTPLFSSVWLALFSVIRRNFNERRLAATENTQNKQEMK